MKPKAPTPHETGMLEYLEDIIGSNRFVDDIEAAVCGAFEFPIALLLDYSEMCGLQSSA